MDVDVEGEDVRDFPGSEDRIGMPSASLALEEMSTAKTTFTMRGGLMSDN